MEYKVGDKFIWKEGRCCIDFYKNDEYELRYDEKNNTYSLATIYSDCGDYDEFQVNKTYEEICDIIDKDLDSINKESDVNMKDLFKELEGKDIRIKTDVLEEDTDVDMLEEIEDNFYVIEETTGKRVFEGNRRECFDYYKTHVDTFKEQEKRIAVLKEL